MDRLLEPGTELSLARRKAVCRITEFIGAGSQAYVYGAESRGTKLAVKIFRDSAISADPRLCARLARIADSPPPGDSFLWPLDLVDSGGLLGYAMALREPGFVPASALLTRAADPTFRNLCKAACRVAFNLSRLHRTGRCHRDISLTNVWVDPSSGRVLISDNDLVDEPGSPWAITGTPRFIAPELISGDAPPDIQTDNHALAVLLFYMLMLGHPLEGRLELGIRSLDAAAFHKLYGNGAVFIWDPENRSNAPDPVIHRNPIAYWSLYPRYLRALFTRTFTAGLVDPRNGRISSAGWAEAILTLHDSIVSCEGCDSQNFLDPDSAIQDHRTKSLCWACGAALTAPPILKIGNRVIVASEGAAVYPVHIGASDFSDPFSSPISRFVKADGASKMCLDRLSVSKIAVIHPDGSKQAVRQGEPLVVKAGMRVSFGATTGHFTAY